MPVRIGKFEKLAFTGDFTKGLPLFVEVDRKFNGHCPMVKLAESNCRESVFEENDIERVPNF
jgi:hypothetical protein